MSLMYDGRLIMRGLRWMSVNVESLSVGESQPEIMGRPGLLGLCILGSR